MPPGAAAIPRLLPSAHLQRARGAIKVSGRKPTGLDMASKALRNFVARCYYIDDLGYSSTSTFLISTPL